MPKSTRIRSKAIAKLPESELNITLRDILAIDRTRLANQRTLLAFVGTFLHFGVLGLTFAKIEEFSTVTWLAIPMFLIGIIFLIVGILTFYKNRKSIHAAYAGSDFEK